MHVQTNTRTLTKHRGLPQRAGLGQTTAALNQFQQVLDHVRAGDGDVSPMAFDLRRDIALLLAERDTDQALAHLDSLHHDLFLVYGPDHDDTREAADILDRLRRTEGSAGP